MVRFPRLIRRTWDSGQNDGMPLEPTPCLNCGAPLQGPFCHRCGQKDQARKVRLGHLLGEMLGEFLNYDQKVLSSFWLLIRRPGFLAREYLEGRRVRHLSPLRLYVVTSFLTFLLFSLVPVGPQRKPGAGPIKVQIQTEVQRGTGQPVRSAWGDSLEHRIKRAVADPDHFKQVFLTNLSRALFLLMPFLALVLFLLHLRTRTFFMEHMVLSLHYHAFSFLVILLLMGLALLPGEDWGTLPGLVLIFLPPVYLALALQNLHRRGWVRSFLRAAVASAIYGLALATALLGLLYVSLPGVEAAAPVTALQNP
jgi:hypothetical protein